MIDHEIKKAWRDETNDLDYEACWVILRAAYVQAEARARMAEYCSMADYGDPKVRRSLTDYVREVEAELSK